jgi:hypothetical protein
MSALVTERLTDTSVANIVSQRRMDLIKMYYASIHPAAARYFVDDNPATGNHGVRYSRYSFLFTMASMVIVVNSVVAGTTVALVFGLAVRAPAPVPVIAGIAAGVGLLAVASYYQHLRVTPVVLSSPAALAADRDAGETPPV